MINTNYKLWFLYSDYLFGSHQSFFFSNQIIDLSFNRADTDFRVKQTGWSNYLFNLLRAPVFFILSTNWSL